MLKVSVALVCAISTALIGGCATDLKVGKDAKTAETQAAQTQLLQANRGSLVTATSDAFLAGDAIEAPPQRAAILNQDVQYVTVVPVNVADIASFITEKTGLQVDVSALQQPSAPGGSQILAALQQASQGGMPREIMLTLRHDGPLYQLLDQVAGKTNSWWSFDDGEVRFFRTITQTFTLAEMPQSRAIKSTIDTTNSGDSAQSGASGSGGSSSGSTGSGGGTSTSGMTASATVNVDPWKDIKDAAQAVAGNAKVAVDPYPGTVTVTGTPAEVHQVGEWVKSYNSISAQQVQVTMQVYKVQLNKEDNYGINPSVVFQKLNGNGWSISGLQLPATVASTNPASIAASIVAPSSTSGVPANGYTGSKVAVQALSTVGKVTETFSSSEVTKNGHTAVLTNGNSIGYLYEVSTLLSANVGQQATLTPGTVNTGISWMATPRIVDGTVHMSVSISDGALVSMTTISSGGNSIQTPNVSILALQNDVILRPGEALLLTGMDDSNGQSTHNGIGDANNPLLGGGFDASTGRSIIAIVITAKVL
jgi:type IVB pilus formation R64 PilN family outer membrane protein